MDTDETQMIATRAVGRQIRIVDETDDFIVIDKPAHLLVHPSRPDSVYTLWHGLRELLAFEIVNSGQISIINRLDRETSGLILIAKTRSAARAFSDLMVRHAIAKEYRAIVWGWPDCDEYEIEARIARKGAHGPSAIYLQRAVYDQGAQAHTSLKIERRFRRESSNGERFSVVHAVPHTGRTHQIRVHLAHLGHPVVGDKIYGPDEQHYLTFVREGWTDELARSLLLPRHALHSASLRIDELGLRWEAPLPDDLSGFISL